MGRHLLLMLISDDLDLGVAYVKNGGYKYTARTDDFDKIEVLEWVVANHTKGNLAVISNCRNSGALLLQLALELDMDWMSGSLIDPRRN
jgi:hypothetical protein